MIRSILRPLAALVVCAQPVLADVIIDSLSRPLRGVTVLGTEPPDNIWAAQAFSVPEEYALSSITLLLGNSSAGNDPVAQLREGATPDAPVIATFPLPALLEAGIAEITLVPDVPVTLAPGSTYWIVIGTQSTGACGWAYGLGQEWIGPGTVGAFTYSEDQGVTWGAAGVKNPYLMRVEGTTGPECPADFNNDGTVNSTDVSDFVNQWFQDQASGTLLTDWDANGVVNSTDVSEFINSWFEDIAAGCGG